MKQYSPKGFTVFFAMLVASLSLAIGLAIFDLTIRELDLASTVTQSEYAVYAADAGAECALYWDNKYNTNNSVFPTSTQSTLVTSNVLCNGIDIAAAAVTAGTWPISSNATAATSSFTLTFAPQTYCTLVTVEKSGTPSQTIITTHGYNRCGGGGLQLERVFKITY